MTKIFNSFLLTICVLFCFAVAKAQSFPDTAWTRCYGGSLSDEGVYIQQTFDGGYIVLGMSTSIDGDLVNAPAGNKNWILKLDGLGNIEWQKTSPGTGIHPLNIRQTSDSGYIYGGNEFTKLDAAGNIVQQESILCEYVAQALDGNYVYSFSNYLTKLDLANNIDWFIGGGMGNYIASLEQTPDSGFVTSLHDPGDQSPDVHLFRKINKNGLEDFLKSLSEGSIYAITNTKPTLDGEYISVSVGNIFLEGWGYIKKGDSTLSWAKEMSDLYPTDIVQNPDSTFVFCGVDTAHQAIISKITPAGADIITLSFGGSNIDEFRMMCNTRDSGYVVIGKTQSQDGDVWNNHGSSDLWIVKFKKDTSVYTAPAAVKSNYKANEINVYPTLTTGTVHIDLPEGHDQAAIEVLNITGQPVPVKESGKGSKRTVDFCDAPSGQYFIHVKHGVEKTVFRVSLMR